MTQPIPTPDPRTSEAEMKGGKKTAGPRCYLPSAYVDEWCPPLRPSPSDWIIRGNSGWHLVACPDYMDDDGDRPGAALIDGQTVKFDWRELWPDRVITVRISEDGEITYDPLGFIPASINMLWLDGDSDTMTDMLQSCIEAYHDMHMLKDGHELDLSMAEWGDDSFRFVLKNDVARFDLIPQKAPTHAR